MPRKFVPAKKIPKSAVENRRDAEITKSYEILKKITPHLNQQEIDLLQRMIATYSNRIRVIKQMRKEMNDMRIELERLRK